LRGVFDINSLKNRIEILIKKTEEGDLWSNKLEAQRTLKEKSVIEEKISDYEKSLSDLNDYIQYYQLAKAEDDNILIEDILKNLLNLKKEVEYLEIKSLFSEENDLNYCFVDINAGAGGTDSCDFALMLLRMYQRFANRHNFKAEIVSMLDGEEAGIRGATLKISGKYAFGWLKNESGVHRLVRISPFNANDKRQTSFASVWVYPEIEDDIEIEILDKDLRVDTYRASGAGGQHVNKTDSAVRITHLPTNIVVQCQSDRSQIKNRAEAMKMLKSRLYEAQIKKRQEKINEAEANKTDNSWGHQIRSYVLHPYQMVKDLRTGHETGNTQAVLDGAIDDFIKNSLIKQDI